MITARITNIVLEWELFKVFVSFSNWIDEQFGFRWMLEKEQLINTINAKKQYYEELKIQEQELKEDLLNIEL